MLATWDLIKGIFSLYFKSSKNYWANKKVYVAKVVYLFVQIPEQLSLHFSDFSTIFERIYKFAVFQNKKKKETETSI